MLAPWKKSYDQPRHHIKKQRRYFADKCPSSQSYGFSSSHIWMWELDYKESWAPKSWCFWTVCWRRLLRVPLTARRSNQSVLTIHWKDWCWIWNSNTLATCCEEPTHWKTPWCWERLKAGEGTTEYEMVGWHHWPDRHEFEQALGIGDGQRSLACCSPWGRRGSDMTKQLNWTLILNWARTKEETRN